MLLELMSKPLLDRSQYGPPEHFDDLIRAYRSSERYIPTALEQLLFELAGHRCTICKAPWLEIHHIDELNKGGITEYNNLIVLCPNCHTRVHANNVPSKDELKNYKRKQEIAYELPILSRLRIEEKILINELVEKTPEEQLIFSKRIHRNIAADSQDEAIEILKREAGYFELHESGMLSVDLEHVVTMEKDVEVSVSLRIKLTGKGVKWLRYLTATKRVPLE